MTALEKGYFSVAELLLSKGVSVDEKSPVDGDLPLHLACKQILRGLGELPPHSRQHFEIHQRRERNRYELRFQP